MKQRYVNTYVTYVKNKNNSRLFVKPNVKRKAMNLLEVNTLESYTTFLGFLKNSEIEHGSKQLDYTKMRNFIRTQHWMKRQMKKLYIS